MLRGGAAVVSIDVEDGAVLERRSVCAYPRGVAYDPGVDSIHVACADGYLVTLPAAGGEPTRGVELERDLRDVIVENGRIWVSSFRSAEVLRLDENAEVVERLRPADMTDFDAQKSVASVAARLLVEATMPLVS